MFYSIFMLVVALALTAVLGEIPDFRPVLAMSYACALVLAYVEYRASKREVELLVALTDPYAPMHQTCAFSRTTATHGE